LLKSFLSRFFSFEETKGKSVYSSQKKKKSSQFILFYYESENIAGCLIVS